MTPELARTYEEWKKQKCKWCAEGFTVYDTTHIPAMHGNSFVPRICTAPFIEAYIAEVWAKYDAIRKTLVSALMPLEVLYTSDKEQPYREISPMLRVAIEQAVLKGRSVIGAKS